MFAESLLFVVYRCSLLIFSLLLNSWLSGRHRPSIQALVMCFLRGDNDVQKIEVENNERIYEIFNFSSKREETNCEAVEIIKHSTCRWFGLID